MASSEKYIFAIALSDLSSWNMFLRIESGLISRKPEFLGFVAHIRRFSISFDFAFLRGAPPDEFLAIKLFRSSPSVNVAARAKAALLPCLSARSACKLVCSEMKGSRGNSRADLVQAFTSLLA